ncbi:hypothetical protein V8G54_032342 [Vigna mungo]|uniref:Uncharacterized protein n=1 Tax=Vigna mungo TaxID=3915 RepID=A0AAQ3MMQ5_VIGMU
METITKIAGRGVNNPLPKHPPPYISGNSSTFIIISLFKRGILSFLSLQVRFFSTPHFASALDTIPCKTKIHVANAMLVASADHKILDIIPEYQVGIKGHIILGIKLTPARNYDL